MNYQLDLESLDSFMIPDEDRIDVPYEGPIGGLRNLRAMDDWEQPKGGHHGRKHDKKKQDKKD